MAADLTGIVIAPPTPLAKVGSFYRKLRRSPIIPLFLLGLVVFAGIFAPVIAPHDPEKGELGERNIPPAWGSGEKSLKTVVERLSLHERATSGTVKAALLLKPNIELGDQLEIVT